MNTKHTFPLCLYPTTVILIDDNENYLRILSSGLLDNDILSTAFDNPHSGIQFINTLPNTNKFNTALEVQDDENAYIGSRSNISINLEQLYLPVFDPNRFREISTVVIDYNMPELKGDKLASLISHKYIKKLMLTGVADHKIAIDLLNHKIIDNFAEKPLEGIDDKLLSEIASLQKDYFSQLTQPIVSHCFSSESIVSSYQYQHILKNIIEQHNIVEYYTLSMTGSKLLLDENGTQYWLVVANESDMEGWAEIANLNDDTEANIIDSFNNREKLLFLFTEEEQKLAPTKWANKLHPVHTISIGSELYYYSLICENKLPTSEICSYHQFLANSSQEKKNG